MVRPLKLTMYFNRLEAVQITRICKLHSQFGAIYLQGLFSVQEILLHNST